MTRLFGTDGIRGVAGADLTAGLFREVGWAITQVLGLSGQAVVAGRDTRASGDFLEEGLAGGLIAGGAEVLLGGILPTPAVAFLTEALGAGAGAVISASHNPARDNGVKFFGPDGFKISEEVERAVEKKVGGAPAEKSAPGGRGRPLPDAEARYIAHALEALEGRRLRGLKVVVDCANGAAYRTTPAALGEAGAEVVAINAQPDGQNINLDSGSLHPEVVAGEVRRLGADAGLAHDGDADRVIAVDERGEIVDGDAMLAMLALELKQQGRLPGGLVVGTVMANLGLRRAFSQWGIEFYETPVGDRYVLDAMLELGAAIGGEQSGHLILSDYASTGDGLITGLRLLGRMVATGRRLSELASVVERYPQVLVNVAVTRPGRLEESEEVRTAVRRAEAELGADGRVLVRPSGTEPLVRVMVEAPDEHLASSTAETLAEVVIRVLGG